MPRHFRIRHAREDAADGSDLVAGYLDDTPWYCEVCGEYVHNAAHWAQCVMCNEPQGAYLCDCGHKNPPTAKRCQECGERREAA